MIPLTRVTIVVKFIDTESRKVTAETGERGMRIIA
jgi:hypothetical protein